MGDYRVVIEGIGSHGCGREAKDGDVVTRCGNPGCVDCIAIAAVESLKTAGSVAVARVEHWPVPGAAGTTRTENAGPVDDLIAGTRSGQFGG